MGVTFKTCQVCQEVTNDYASPQTFYIVESPAVFACEECKVGIAEMLDPEVSPLLLQARIGRDGTMEEFVTTDCVREWYKNLGKEDADKAEMFIKHNRKTIRVTSENIKKREKEILLENNHLYWIPTRTYLEDAIDRQNEIISEAKGKKRKYEDLLERINKGEKFSHQEPTKEEFDEDEYAEEILRIMESEGASKV